MNELYVIGIYAMDRYTAEGLDRRLKERFGEGEYAAVPDVAAGVVRVLALRGGNDDG
ncbi:MAG: hypothetical protein IJV67_02490 [Clostridia bacterium]|nr:hypothetical protein [Clostridia bacterium]